MNNIFSDFKSVNKNEWESKIVSDLKGKDPSILQNHDPIEELDFSSYYHNEDIKNSIGTPGNYPYLRGMNSESNSWKNGALIEFDNEGQANQKALRSLNLGVNLLIFKSTKVDTNWKEVLANIQMNLIETQFVIRDLNEFRQIFSITGNTDGDVKFNIDFIEDGWSEEGFSEVADNFKQSQKQFCSVSGFKLQRSGATTWQEIAFCLNTGHEYLLRLMNLGFSIDEASACISFKVGIGDNYFYEAAKFRTIKQLWSKVVGAYNPMHGCSHNIHITAISGLSNKSLLDPYTNLLRQTTEAMSAVIGGIDGIVILPYDHYSSKGSSELSERMAINISTILAEESYLDRVIDAMGGSYSLENLTTEIGKKSWALFQNIESLSGIFNEEARKMMSKALNEKRAMRVNAFNNNEITLIGVNKHNNPESKSDSWVKIPGYLNCDVLILENELKTVSA